ncbi:scavenger receptor class B member 1-like isoform X2 [Sitophilus oryzae]|uniref:Scavenger receptor class B member 1 n=1 Tax=Sitophilus oryzae TaxID=7048 RepID=A0A6J2YN93_SITOR|nr:scavenger receptor class B member 1-like isoform X2 [Sitophilus oryzae]
MSDVDGDINRSREHVYGGRKHSNLSNLERNCNEMFAKGPALTKDFFEKIQNDVVPPKTDLFGYTMNTRRFILLTGLIILFTFSTIGTITMWFTEVYKKQINSLLVITDEAPTYEMWRSPTVKPYIKIYIFNYTNVERYEMRKDKKLHVEEIGPYVYYEKLERVNVRFNKVDGTVSYQEKRTYIFSPELSNGTKHDLVMVPNIPVLAGVSIAKHYNFFLRVSFSGFLSTLSVGAFIPLTVDQFVNGYEDNFYDWAKSYLKFHDMRVFEHFGLLVWKAGLQPDVITVNTGLHDISRRGQVEKFNGQTQIDLWGSDSCNSVQASDGIIYPLTALREKRDLTFYMPHMCRKLSLKFEKTSSILDSIPVHRYKLPLDTFDNEDKCYCTSGNGQCPPKGMFNATPCAFDAPLYYSWPHFYNGDPELRANISGLKDDFLMNDTYANIHPSLGVLVGGKIKFQVNIELQKSFGIGQLSAYPDRLMIPTVWMETGVEPSQLPIDFTTALYQITFTVKNIELGLKYGTLLATMVTLTCILLVLKKQRHNRSRASSHRRSIDYVH